MAQEEDLPTTDEIYQLVKENNRMLRAMRRDAFVKGILSLVWWVLLLVVIPYVSWLFIQPYLKTVTDAYTQVQGTTDSLNSSLSGLPDLNTLLEQFTGGAK